MSYEDGILDQSYLAAEAMSANRFVVLEGNTVRYPSSDLDPIFGILQSDCILGDVAVVRSHGLSKVHCNAALGVGTLIGPVTSGSDAGQAQDAGTNWKQAAAILLSASEADGGLPSCQIIGPVPQGCGTIVGQTVVSTITTAGAATFTPAQLLGGLILRDCAGASRTDVSPTAVSIIAAMPQAGIGNSFEFTIRNTSDDVEVITLSGGDGVSLSGTMTIAQNYSRRFLAVVTSATEVTIYSLGTLVH